MQFSKAILLVTSIFAIGLCSSGCSNNSSTSSSKSSSSQSSATKKTEAQIVGSYRDDADGAAITLNSDGTGTYVMANPTKADIHDQLTWKKEKNNYIINLNDSNYDTPIDARLNEDNLSLVGNDEWPNQSFRRVHGDFNIDDFLNEQHSKNSNSSKNTEPKESSSHARAALKKWAKDHHKDSKKIDSLKATTDLSEPDEGWAFVDDNGTEYAIVRNGKVYPRPVIDNDDSSN
ncbi:lipocalin/fatty acid-binding family protein [Limosilactobacillus sp. STM2_1]|uniref:Lipocalin/fatty acid-binding family protein n=1 Tax=Limosilactobacillus rudii TaxID=2759755 RepID=A0A7W3UN10_9LACO|nr:lipocalin/fatty acid-binding family protein [Limosilactobacillus rudii]MBB1080455.1 lipocalin/fatty acid-binding family protein [Limosilactobacillus rudii]MBB1098481.1 lipocalin/fatty acid-binding family protein [Limosilactobacillus rudii]MCD7135489.1 lipocalin/fatty acid-binding family protein [Limosilactobacillus rudii]